MNNPREATAVLNQAQRLIDVLDKDQCNANTEIRDMIAASEDTEKIWKKQEKLFQIDRDNERAHARLQYLQEFYNH